MKIPHYKKSPIAIILALATIFLLAPGQAHAGEMDNMIQEATNDPTECWSCKAVLIGISLSQQILTTAVDPIANNLWAVFSVLFFVTLIYVIGRNLAAGLPVIVPIISMVSRFLPVAMILSIYGGASAIGTRIITIPALEIGAAAGVTIADATRNSLGINFDGEKCKIESPSKLQITDPDFVELANDITPLVCRVHNSMSIVYTIGASISSDVPSGSQGRFIQIAIVFAGVGTTLMGMGIFALVDYAATILELFVRLAAFQVFFPLILIFWIWNFTQKSVARYFAAVMYCSVYLALSGIGSTVTVYLMLLGMSYGVGQTTLLDPSDIYAQWNTIGQFSFAQMLLTKGYTANYLANCMRMCAYCTIVGTLAIGLNRGIQRTAMIIAQYQPGKSGDRAFAGAVMSTVSAAQNITTMLGNTMAVGMASRIGAFIGRLFR